jgi:hypothetical protein
VSSRSPSTSLVPRSGTSPARRSPSPVVAPPTRPRCPSPAPTLRPTRKLRFLRHYEGLGAHTLFLLFQRLDRQRLQPRPHGLHRTSTLHMALFEHRSPLFENLGPWPTSFHWINTRCSPYQAVFVIHIFYLNVISIEKLVLLIHCEDLRECAHILVNMHGDDLVHSSSRRVPFLFLFKKTPK